MSMAARRVALKERETAFLQLCDDAGYYGAVAPINEADVEIARTLEAMFYLRREGKHGFTITAAGRAALQNRIKP